MSEGSAQEFSTAELNLSYGDDGATHTKKKKLLPYSLPQP